MFNLSRIQGVGQTTTTATASARQPSACIHAVTGALLMLKALKRACAAEVRGAYRNAALYVFSFFTKGILPFTIIGARIG